MKMELQQKWDFLSPHSSYFKVYWSEIPNECLWRAPEIKEQPWHAGAHAVRVEQAAYLEPHISGCVVGVPGGSGDGFPGWGFPQGAFLWLSGQERTDGPYWVGLALDVSLRCIWAQCASLFHSSKHRKAVFVCHLQSPRGASCTARREGCSVAFGKQFTHVGTVKASS